MAYTDFNFALNEHAPVKGDDKKHWDIALSCYEPLTLVTGGIGTYTRLLLNLFSQENSFKNKKIAFFCRSISQDIKKSFSPNITVFELGEDWSIYHKRAERLGNEHDWYSWNLSHYLLKLTLAGHTFNFFEFPDYAIEAYFPLKMLRAGLLKINTLSLRLHSPELMLFRDNCFPGRHYDLNRFTRMSRELFCYEHADLIQYGAPAMLERVQSECNRFGIDLSKKTFHVEHPYPIAHSSSHTKNSYKKGLHDNTIHLAYIGRLEIRKGILQFLKKISKNKNILSIIESLNIVFDLYGADCTDQYYNSVQKQILSLQKNPTLKGRIIVHGYMSQKELKNSIKHVDGFIFPSLFENYPNALLEILHTESPILISDSGGMPYISKDLPGIYSFNYKENFNDKVQEFFCSIRKVPNRSTLYDSLQKNVNESISEKYLYLSNLSKERFEKEENLGVDFVIPYFNDSAYLFECLESIKALLKKGDAIYVIDDSSTPVESAAAQHIINKVFDKSIKNSVTLKRLQKNSGPSVARNTGAYLGVNPLIQFIDADDTLNRTGFIISKKYLQRNNSVDFSYGIQDNYGYRSHVWIPRDSSIMTALDENYTHSAILIRRQAFEGIKGFDDDLRLHFEDWQFNCKLALKGYRGEVLPFVTQHYRVRETSRTYLNLESEAFSREQVIDRTCINRDPQRTLLEGELIELLGKYANMIHGQWNGTGEELTSNIGYIINDNLSFDDLLTLEGKEFVYAAYHTILGRKADYDGLNFYVGKVNNEKGKYTVIASMMNSKEMKNKRITLPDTFYKKTRWIRLKQKIL